MCLSKKSKFINEQKARGLSSSLGIKAPVIKIPLAGPLFFRGINNLVRRYKMNEIVNKFLLEGYKFMSEMHLRQHGFTYSACGSFTKNKKRIHKFKEAGNS